MLIWLLERWRRLRLRANVLRAGFLRVGSGAYRQRTSEEIEHYHECHGAGEPAAASALMEPAPAVWEEMQRRASGLVSQELGADIVSYVAGRLAGRAEARLVSLGCGPGGVELAIARQARAASILCLDLNPGVLALGREAAEAEGLNVRFEPTDLNTVTLEPGAFDVVFCHASLHHILELERLADQIKRTLREGGALVVTDVITRNGYRMWPETRRTVQAIWKTLPERYRVNHTAYAGPRIDEKVWESDMRGAGMECLRSQDILPVLRERFEVECFVPQFALCRRFFDTMYGPNYDLSRPLDRAVVDWIWELDCDLIREGKLGPETFFGVFH